MMVQFRDCMPPTLPLLIIRVLSPGAHTPCLLWLLQLGEGILEYALSGVLMSCDVIWCTVMWYDVLWCDMMYCDVIWCDVILYGSENMDEATNGYWQVLKVLLAAGVDPNDAPSHSAPGIVHRTFPPPPCWLRWCGHDWCGCSWQNCILWQPFSKLLLMAMRAALRYHPPATLIL